MGSGSIDNVAGFAAELDMAFESLSFGGTVDFSSFALQPLSTSTISSVDEQQEDDQPSQEDEPLQIGDKPREDEPSRVDQLPKEVQQPRQDEPSQQDQRDKEDESSQIDEQPRDPEPSREEEQPKEAKQPQEEEKQTEEHIQEAAQEQSPEDEQAQDQLQERIQQQIQDLEHDHGDENKENQEPSETHAPPYREPPPRPSFKTHSRDISNTSTRTAIPVTVPAQPIGHPLPCMQGAFDESIKDSMDPPPTKAPFDKLNPEARRRQMLELDAAEQGYSSRWHLKAGSQYHPLWKLIAQISFGIHLLHQQLAKSDRDVVRILQAHVDDVDSFVEDTVADFDLATSDIDQRLQSLLLPLEHSRTFNRMLCERTFRQSIMDGNDIIERIVARTAAAMHRSLRDVSEGQEATRELEIYLQRLEPEWPKDDPNLMAVFTAMRGNAQGWLRCFLGLQAKAEHLAKLMNRLTFIVDEVAKRCGIASRRKTPSGGTGRRTSQEPRSPQSPQSPTSPSDSGLSPTLSQRPVDKPLPPPPLRQKNAISLIRNSPALPQVQEEKPSRPSLRSTTSAQTIDCTRPSPPSMNKMGARPSHSSANSQSTVIGPSSPAVAGDPSKNIRSVSHQTGIERIARDKARERLPGRVAAGKSQPASPTRPSHKHRDSHSPVRPRTAHARSTSGPQKPTTHHEPFRIPRRQMSAEPQPLAGLGIDPSTIQCNSSASTIKDFTCLDDPPPKEPVAKVTAKKPETDEAPPRPRTSSSTTSPRKSMQASFSVFPSSTDLRLRNAAEETKSRSAKTTPRISTESRTSDKMLPPSRTSRESSVPSTTVESSYQSSLETPSLSSTTSQSHTEQGPASSSFPRTPDDFNPHWALSSHPITESMYIPAPVSPITALPPYRGPPAEEVHEEEPVPVAQTKKPSLMKKASMTTMKGFFAKKPPKKESYHGNGGLGGFVPVTQTVR